uniref:NTR domain-containing protein n=1 Tax=Ditylenchus dipsaci TaxID=166011 RepID=A0A915CQB2_9BILA
MTFLIKFIAFVVAACIFCTSQTEACQCAPMANFTQAYCQANWVSHVEVISNSSSEDNAWLKYEVKHIKTFKTPSEAEPLPASVLTPSHSATCGITELVNANQYLMAGTVDEGKKLHIYSCLYMPLQDMQLNNQQSADGVLQWKHVPDSLVQQLSTTNNSTCA